MTTTCNAWTIEVTLVSGNGLWESLVKIPLVIINWRGAKIFMEHFLIQAFYYELKTEFIDQKRGRKETLDFAQRFPNIRHLRTYINKWNKREKKKEKIGSTWNSFSGSPRCEATTISTEPHQILSTETIENANMNENENWTRAKPPRIP